MKRVTDDQIREWAIRHDFQGTLTDLRCAFEDAQSLEQESAPAAERKPREWWLAECKAGMAGPFESEREAQVWDEADTPVVHVREVLAAPSPAHEKPSA